MVDALIRPIRQEDDEILYKIESECFSMAWSKAQFSILPSLDYAHFFMIEYKGQAVGFAGIYVLDVAELVNIAVLPKFRKLGLGSQLLQTCINKAKELNVSSIYLEVRQSNLSAISCYQKFGFKSIGIRKKYYSSPLEDANIMVKEI